MPTPKSVIKIKNGNVTYISEVDKCSYYIHELARAALRDVAKYVRVQFKQRFYEHFHRITGVGGRASGYVVYSNARTQHPRVDIGLRQDKKVEGFYAFFQETGTKDGRVPKLQLLQKSVEENVNEIVKIQSQYLSALDGGDSQVEPLIDENDMEEKGGTEP